jgi:hypothetical protein
VVLALLEFGRCGSLQFHIIQHFQNESGLSTIGRE